ncbi:MAG: amino acid permease [Candidatus Thermoplasmatota archaeon]|nr:amino acid permease [Euryarchaeota archaeon]MBU4032438.1 amino acid permease [Candidatus Thermoplasmatota archaeon]MBU4144482.1 amino acid permease [Candidatus Thermoplasmatota archaeon]MBU4592286.1 amino acid permease [Candidatus Thermoplasmatota archaeon]
MENPPDSGVEVKLKQDLGLLQVIIIGLGPTLGSTIFLLIGYGLEITGPGLVLVMILNFSIIMLTAVSYAELNSAFTSSGGEYSWVREGLPEPIGFLSGWMLWFGNSIVTSFYVLGFGKGIIWILDAYGKIPPGFDGDLLVKVLAASACVVFIYINYKGTKETGITSMLITGILLAVIIAFIIAGAAFLYGGGGDGDVGAIVSNPIPNGISSLFVAMGLTFIVFEGFDLIAQCGEECRNPLKNIPKATWICVTFSTILFILVSIICVGVIDWTQIGTAFRGDDVVAQVASLTMPHGLVIVGVGVIFGALAAVNSALFASSRVAFAMGRDGTLPKTFGKLHSKNSTPHMAIIISGAIIIFMAVTLPIEKIAASTAIMFLSVFMMVNLSAIMLRYKRPEVKRVYKIPLFPVLPLVAIGALMILAYALWVEYSDAWFIALGWIAIGLVLYYFGAGKRVIETVGPEELLKKGILEIITERPEDKRYRILVPVLHEGQKQMVEFAALVARVEDADLNIVSVIELPFGTPIDYVKYKETSPYIKLVEKLKKIGDKELIKARGTVLISHAASEAILDTIDEDNVDLLVMGWKGITGENRILGTTIDKLIHSVKCDVIVMKVADLGEKVNRILVVSAPEWHASHATGYAVLIAKRDESNITIFSPYTSDARMKSQEDYAKRLSELCNIHSIPNDIKLFRTNSIEKAIIEEAQNYDLVVMGSTQGENRMAVNFGRVQDRIAKAVDRPILMVKKVRERK